MRWTAYRRTTRFLGKPPAVPDGETMIPLRPTIVYPRPVIAQAFFLGLLLLLLFSGAMAAEAPEKPVDAASPQGVKQFLENALSNERSNLVEVEQNLKRWEALRTSVADEIEAYRIQNAAHGNLLLVLQTRIEDLQTALNNNRLAIKSLSERIAEFEKFGEIATERMAQLSDRIAIAEKQLANLQQEGLLEADRRELKSKFNDLLAILREKEQHGKAFLKDYEILLQQMQDTLNDLTATRRQLEERLRVEARSNLSERTPQPFARLRGPNLLTELAVIRERMAGLANADFWRRQWLNFQRSGGLSQAVFFLLFVTAVIFRRSIRRYIRSIEDRMTAPAWRHRQALLMLLRRSFLLICALAILGLYDLLRLPHVSFSLARFLNQTVLTLLAVRWAIDFLQQASNGLAPERQGFVQTRLTHFLQWLRLLVIGHLTLIWIAGSGSLLVWLVRLMLEIALLVWVVAFWRRMPPAGDEEGRQEDAAPTRRRLVLVRSWGYFVAGGALLMELTGFSVLAAHWLASWAQTLLLALWAHLGWQVIAEWYAAQNETTQANDAAGPPAVTAPLGWFLVQMARMLWLLAVTAGALWVWSSSALMAVTLKQVFGLAFAVGSLSFSVKGLLLAVIILCATHVVTRIGRRLLRERVLGPRNLERGLKDSVVTITTYVLWGLGLVLALGVLGVNATSLAVVFGALSIGIGFGLQNIFNNFISGLILLFERPIQVGDCVEVNGLWAEVKEINVRATIVQTFDNASVIIPNSEFISQQVTNWSFKDPRMRRHVDVGVAYGSDIELVRDTLLEIAADTPAILKFPRPDVIFLDHGDSALIFRLRFWTHLDNYYSTSTDVRFALDHRFRERGIEIAFPQRDLHIRSAAPGLFAGAAPQPPPASSPEGATTAPSGEEP